MIVRAKRHFVIPAGPLSRSCLIITLVLLTSLVLIGGTVPRLLACAAAIPCSIITGTLLRWKACGDFRTSLKWSFMAVLPGLITWVLIK